jgi:hypothetical protein
MVLRNTNRVKAKTASLFKGKPLVAKGENDLFYFAITKPLLIWVTT